MQVVVFEPTKHLKDNPLYSQIASRYLIGSQFNSVEEALSQEDDRGRTLDNFFKQNPRNEDEIEGVCIDYDEGVILHNQPGYAVPLLRTKVVNY